MAVASGAGSFNTLVAAVKAAGLVETLQGTGPFTVFAPTDEAFAKLPKGTVENLLKPENKEKLVAILTYHVVSGKVMAADVKTMKAKTVNGQSLDVKVADGAVTVDNAKVVKTDVAASNGVIHVIDTVVMPRLNLRCRRRAIWLSASVRTSSTSSRRALTLLAWATTNQIQRKSTCSFIHPYLAETYPSPARTIDP